MPPFSFSHPHCHEIPTNIFPLSQIFELGPTTPPPTALRDPTTSQTSEPWTLNLLNVLNHGDPTNPIPPAPITCILPMPHNVYTGDDEGKVVRYDFFFFQFCSSRLALQEVGLENGLEEQVHTCNHIYTLTFYHSTANISSTVRMGLCAPSSLTKIRANHSRCMCYEERALTMAFFERTCMAVQIRIEKLVDLE